jgi:transglutaminase-like putative cysteine protease
MIKQIIAAALFMTGAIYANGQSLEKMQQLFPDKLAIFSNINRSVEIAYEKGEPYAEAAEVSEMMILNERANGLFNKDKVYHSGFNELKKLEAWTMIPDGNNMKKLKVADYKTQSSPSSGIFYDDVKETVFDYPQLVKGSVSHVETLHRNKDIRLLSSFYFSSYLPVHQATFSVLYPDDVELKYIIKNDPEKKITVTESKKGRKKKLEFAASNMGNFEVFGDGTPVSYYAPHVLVYVASYQNDAGKVPVFNGVDELYKWNVAFLKNVNNTADEELKKLAQTITAQAKTPADKAAAIYNWVQQHIKYVAFEDGLEGFVPRQAADVCNKRYGDCKDMASLLTALLTISKLDAYFTWIGTRHIPYRYTEVPLPLTDNHMICAVKIDGQWIFLDATDPNCIYGYPSSGIQGKQALISISPEKYEIAEVPIMPPAKSQITDSTFLQIKGSNLLGRSSVNYTGYYGSNLYNSLQYNKGDDERVYAKRRLGKASNKFTLIDYKFTLTQPEQRIANISGNFEVPDYVKNVGGEIYINMNLEKLFITTPIDTAKRKVAVENEYCGTVHQVHELKIPDGYQVDYLPANFELSNELFDFSIQYKQANGYVTCTQHILNKTLYVQAPQFALWNKCAQQISPVYKEQVVLVKK